MFLAGRDEQSQKFPVYELTDAFIYKGQMVTHQKTDYLNYRCKYKMIVIAKTLKKGTFIWIAQLVGNETGIKIKYKRKLINACNSINTNKRTKTVES